MKTIQEILSKGWMIFRRNLPEKPQMWLDIKTELRSCNRFDQSCLNKTYNEIIKGLDTRTLDKLYLNSRSILSQNPSASAKYYNYKKWLKMNILRAAQSELHLHRGLSILDLGCGSAWFVLVANSYGHKATGVEIPISDMVQEDRAIYQKLTELNKCKDKIIRHRIKPFTPIPIQGNFDLITGFQVCFNNHRKPDVWKADEWRFFIEDLKSHLNTKGRIILELNNDTINFPDKLYYDDTILSLFSTHGSVDRYKVLLSMNNEKN